MDHTISVFGSSYPSEGDSDYTLAFETGAALARAGFTVCNGGYGGTMEASARGAKFAGGRTIGVTSRSFAGKRANVWIDTTIESPDMVERLLKLVSLGDGYVVLKGGTGTLLELAAVWEFMNKSVIARKPVLILGEFWSEVVVTVSRELHAVGAREAAGIVQHVRDTQQCAAVLRQILKNDEG